MSSDYETQLEEARTYFRDHEELGLGPTEWSKADDSVRRAIPEHAQVMDGMIYQLGQTAIRDMDAEWIEARIYELLDESRNMDVKFDGAVEAIALLRVMAREAILQGGSDSDDAQKRWATKWEIHGVGIRVRVLLYTAWDRARSDLKQEGPGA